MFSFRTRKKAIEIALKHNLLWGMSIVDNSYYVGTKEELEKAGIKNAYYELIP